MGEGKRRRLSARARLALESRCTFCLEPPTTWEHAPAIVMFRGKQRLTGYEFPSCEVCNTGTRGADLVAAYISRFNRSNPQPTWQLEEALSFGPMLDLRVPGLRKELFERPSKMENVWGRSPGGILQREVKLKADGPLLASHLKAFGAKLGMALFRQHTGEPLPATGVVFVQPYLNAGLAETEAHATLSIMPLNATMRQGRQVHSEQFAYRYNCDDKTILFALVGFHSNLHFRLLAINDPTELDRQVKYDLGARVPLGGLLDVLREGRSPA